LAPPARFRHEAFFYASDDEFLDGTSSFIQDGLDNDEPTLVVLAAAKNEALRSELEGDADRVMFADMTEVGTNPARIIPAWNEFVKHHVQARRNVRGIGEPISAARTPEELVECQHHESLLNLAFEDTPGFALLCGYDTSTLDDEVIVEARRSHPIVCDHGHEHESALYRGIDAAAAPFSAPLPEPISVPHTKIFQALSLGALREFVAERAVAAGLEQRAADDLVIAANEVATNSVVHGGGGGIARIWEDDGAIVCEINDNGSLDDPLAGRETPVLDQQSGHGLWMVNQLCDLVQLRSYHGGSAVRLHKRRG
jgi:anti-sigma regulatory factor (Ser/Thr protein kinase)